MKNIICVGECALDIIFKDGSPVGSMPGGRVANAAAILARAGLPVIMASEASQDPVGDMAVKYLTDAGVDVTCVDRFVGGHTPLLIFTTDETGKTEITRYEQYGDGGFDIIWPRITDETVVLFGGYYTLDARMRVRMAPFLEHCREVKATMVYVPGFPPGQQSRMTRVMPAVLENLELADVVVARSADLSMIFGTESDARCYSDHIDFYCRSLVDVDTAAHRINYFAGKEVSSLEIDSQACRTMMWNAGAVAGVVAAIFAEGCDSESLDAPAAALRDKILTSAVNMASTASDALGHDWQKIK